MNISRITHDVNPRLMNLMKKDTTKRVGNAVMERLPNEYKIFSYPDGTQTVFDPKGNLVLTQIPDKNGKVFIK